jgi:hypothetical protein
MSGHSRDECTYSLGKRDRRFLQVAFSVVVRFDPKSGCPVTGWMNVPRRWKKERQETGDSCRLRSLPLDMIQIVYVRSQDE